MRKVFLFTLQCRAATGYVMLEVTAAFAISPNLRCAHVSKTSRRQSLVWVYIQRVSRGVLKKDSQIRREGHQKHAPLRGSTGRQCQATETDASSTSKNEEHSRSQTKPSRKTVLPYFPSRLHRFKVAYLMILLFVVIVTGICMSSFIVDQDCRHTLQHSVQRVSKAVPSRSL